MAEMILPGTYIEVRDEGLISAGQISINNVGIVGTSARGPVGEAVLVTSSGTARDMFGDPDDFNNPDETGNPLTLIRSVDLAFANGASNVYIVRAAGKGGVAATYTLEDDSGKHVTLQSLFPGTGYNNAVLAVKPNATNAANLCNVSFTLGRLVETWRDVPTAVADFASVINGTSQTYQFSSLASSRGASQLFTADASAAGGNVKVPAGGVNAVQSAPGVSGAKTKPGDYQDALAALENENAHIIVMAGQEDPTDLIAHINITSNDTMKRERIGIVGDSLPNPLNVSVPAEDTGRIVFVGPGINMHDAKTGQAITLPGAYSAAAVAGLIASLDAHISPTNKVITAEALETNFNGGQLEQLVLQNVLALENKLGSIRVVKGVTTSNNSAWRQITTRRIVDYARFGVRSACDPYIGKLNNDRVRQAMKTTIAGFLTDMVTQEMLIGYTLDVSATREQQIRGICQVVMTLQPTFSIDYIQVIMYLQ